MTTTPQRPIQPAPTQPWWRKAWVAPLATGVFGFALGMGAGVGSSPAIPQPDTPDPAATVTVTAEAEPAPTVTVTTTIEAQPAEATEPAEPTETPEATEEPEATTDDIGARVLAAIDEGMPSGRNAWAAPITNIETISGDTVRVHYQEALTDAEADELGRMVRTFSSLSAPELRTVVIRDTSGIDRNVFS